MMLIKGKYNSNPTAAPDPSDVQVQVDQYGNLKVAGAGVGTGGALFVGGSGITANASFTPAAAAYGALDILDVAKEFAFTFGNGVAVPSGSLIRILTAIVKSDQTSVPASMTSFALQCYSVTPPSAQADNALWTLASADLTSYRGSIPLGSPADLGAALYVKQPNVDLDIKLSGTSIFGELQTTAGFTALATPFEVLLYGIVL